MTHTWHYLTPSTAGLVEAPDKEAARAKVAERDGVGRDEVLIRYISSKVEKREAVRK